MRIIGALVFVAAIVAGSAALASAQELYCITPDDILPTGHLQFELGLDYGTDRSNDIETTAWGVPMSIQYGLTDIVNLDIDWTAYNWENTDDPATQGATTETNASGIGDVYAGARVKLPTASFNSSFGGYLVLPVGGDFGSDELGYAADLAWGRETENGWYWYGQFGVEGVQPEGANDHEWTLSHSLNLDIPSGESMCWTATLDGSTPLDPDGQTAWALLVGPTWSFGPDPAVDFSISGGHGLNEVGGDWLISALLIVRTG